MGVVRDVTIDQLTQAVTGISTSGMSDSTGQAIKNSIDALTTALTTEKANRDASNVTDASAWRSAIGVPYINNIKFDAFSSAVTLNTTNYTDIKTQTFNLKAGSYIMIYFLNATWTQGSYQFYPALKVGSDYVASQYSYANAQTNGMCVFMGRVNIPSDGNITLGIAGRITNTAKTVTIPAYQEIGVFMISRIVD